MQFTAMKVLGGLALGMMATSVIAAPTANTDVSARGAQGVDVPNSEPFAYSTVSRFIISPPCQAFADHHTNRTLRALTTSSTP